MPVSSTHLGFCEMRLIPIIFVLENATKHICEAYLESSKLGDSLRAHQMGEGEKSIHWSELYDIIIIYPGQVQTGDSINSPHTFHCCKTQTKNACCTCTDSINVFNGNVFGQALTLLFTFLCHCTNVCVATKELTNKRRKRVS